MTEGKLMRFVEKYVSQMPERDRRLLSHYGAAEQWQTNYVDEYNVINAAVWESWKDEEDCEAYPWCRSITSSNMASNILETLLGAAWVWRHDTMQSSADEYKHALEFVAQFGSTCAQWDSVLKMAITGVREIFTACPWIAMTGASYDPVLMTDHLDALRFGFLSGCPFNELELAVFPLHSHSEKYSVETLQLLQQAMEVCRLEIYHTHIRPRAFQTRRSLA